MEKTRTRTRTEVLMLPSLLRHFVYGNAENGSSVITHPYPLIWQKTQCVSLFRIVPMVRNCTPRFTFLYRRSCAIFLAPSLAAYR